MDNTCSAFDDTSIACSPKSPIKTSTVVKENIKWSEDAFFKRRGYAQGSESLFLVDAESSISVLNGHTNLPKDSTEKPGFQINDSSFISEGANSSLGILQVENLSGLSDESFSESVRKPKTKKTLRRIPKVCTEDKINNLSKVKLDSSSVSRYEESDSRSDSSSDIEYDGTNIPELNPDFDVLSLIDSSKAYTSRSNVESFISESKGSDTLKSSVNGTYRSGYTSTSSQFAENFLKSDTANRESTGNGRHSIFGNIRPSYNSLSQRISIASGNGAKEKSKNVKIPKTIRVCPFLDMSSFEVEVEPSKQNITSYCSDVENIRCGESQSVDFYPEHISARSSSFRSSLRSGLTSVISDTSNREQLGLSSTSDGPQISGDLENEVLGGSCFLTPTMKLTSPTESFGNENNQDAMFSTKDSSDTAENLTGNSNSDLAVHKTLGDGELQGFHVAEEDWCNRLGISESAFFNSDEAKELLKKDTEAFEKENMLEIVSASKVGNVADWSPNNQLQITAPSWYSDTSPSNEQNSGHRISIGTLMNARSEQLGSLSEDSERQRPFFGTDVTTPTRNRQSSIFALEISDETISKIPGHNLNKIRPSTLSEILDDTSFSDPINLASKLVDKFNPIVKMKTRNLISTNINNKQSDYIIQQTSDLQREVSANVLSDIDESESTLMQSNSVSNLSKQSDISHHEIKPAASASAQSLESTLNLSNVSSACESIKSDKSDVRSSCSVSSSQPDTPHEYSRPTSSCSSSCHNPVSFPNAFALQYGCMNYMNTGQDHNQCVIPSNYIMLQNGNSAFSCPHMCSQHAGQPNILSMNAPNSFQPVQNALSGASLPMLSGTPLGIEAPAELCLPEKISLGDSEEINLTVRNASVATCYHISCVSAYLNDSPLPLEMSGLSYNKTVPSNTGNTTDIKLVLAPRYEGKFDINLQIDAISNSVNRVLNAVPHASSRTKIVYEVVRPTISLLNKGKNILNIGPVISGSTFVEYITLVNNCEVSVPLRISLSNDSPTSQIYFGLREMDRQKCAASGSLRFLSPKVMLYRLPGTKNESLPSRLEIPIVFESIRGEINATVTAAVETPTLSEVLAFIRISVSAGNAKLILKDSSQNPLKLKTSVGSTCSHSLTVLNDGTISVVYDLQVESDSDCFSVSPISLNLQPKQSSVISVTYSPLNSQAVKGSLLAAAEPHGQVFTIAEIFGNILASVYPSYRHNPMIHPSQPTRDSINSTFESCNLIECNKKYLSWGGTDIGRTVIKTFTMRNPGREVVQAKLHIRDKAQAFHLVDDSSHKTLSYKFTLNAREEKVISVCFNPAGVASYSGLLFVKPVIENERPVFSIPLSGYGGTSKIKVLGLPDGEGTGYCLDVDVSSNAETVYRNVTLHNVGFRAAFVKILVTYDSFVQNLMQKQTVVNPSEFVLLENEKKNIFVSINSMNRNSSGNGVISILYGDEIMRQALRRNANSALISCDSSHNINFHVPYDGEDRVPYDSSRVFSPKDDSFFYTSLKKLMIHLFFNGQNASFSRMDFTALSEVQDSFANMTLNSTASMRRLTIEGHSPPVKESAIRGINRLSLPLPFEGEHLLKTVDPLPHSVMDELKNLKLDSWSVFPEELILDADNKDNRILLTSYSKSDMRFKVECAIDVIIISPVSGIIAANGEIGLRLTLINNNHSKLLEDYQGFVKISCDGLEKNVVVKVIKDQKKGKCSSMLRASSITNLSLKSGFLGDTLFMDNTLVLGEPTSETVQVENISSFPKHINLPKTKQGLTSEVRLVVSNPSKNAVTWSISPMSMLFTEPFEDSVDCSRFTIEFLSSSGILKSMETETIVIQFSPACVAEFSQFFELSLSFDNGLIQKNNIKVQGEAVADLPTAMTSKSHESEVNKKQKSKTKKRANAEIFVDKDIYEFAATAPGQKSSSDITIKNVSAQDIKLNIMKPRLPFIVRHSSVTVRSGKFLKVPVHFKPLKQASYETEMKFASENGHELKVKLKGCST